MSLAGEDYLRGLLMSPKSAIYSNRAVIINRREVGLRTREAFVAATVHHLINRLDFNASGHVI